MANGQGEREMGIAPGRMLPMGGMSDVPVKSNDSGFGVTAIRVVEDERWLP